MTQPKLNSFHGDQDVQLSAVKHIYEWLDIQMRPRSAREIAEKIFATTKVFEPSDCMLENFELFTKELELPAWLFRLLMTINHNYSNGFDGLKSTYESKFYEQFMFACNVGVDYTLMFHQWEVYMLGDFLPESASGNTNVAKAIELHKQALSGLDIPHDEWVALHVEVEKSINELNDHDDDRLKKFQWTINRVVFLSVEEVINPKEHWTSSVDAAVDVRYLEVINEALANGRDTKKLQDFKKVLWSEVCDDLIDLVRSYPTMRSISQTDADK